MINILPAVRFSGCVWWSSCVRWSRRVWIVAFSSFCITSITLCSILLVTLRRILLVTWSSLSWTCICITSACSRQFSHCFFNPTTIIMRGNITGIAIACWYGPGGNAKLFRLTVNVTNKGTAWITITRTFSRWPSFYNVSCAGIDIAIIWRACDDPLEEFLYLNRSDIVTIKWNRSYFSLVLFFTPFSRASNANYLTNVTILWSVFDMFVKLCLGPQLNWFCLVVI